MSELVTVSSGITGTIYGLFADASAYIGGSFGDAYVAWLALSTADQKRTLIAATRYLDRLEWVDDYDTFALRDAYADDAGAYPFQLAAYELAALAADDASVLAAADQSSNVQSVTAGGAGVTFFNPTSTRLGSASKLPPVLQALIGAYLAGSSAATAIGGSGVSGSCSNPFSGCRDDDRNGPW